ncbi:MAG: hypothetical protein KBC64_08105 [Simkaniaceae bacterium]|nr:hypothetical protein [Simkaniaceae bacterium]
MELTRATYPSLYPSLTPAAACPPPDLTVQSHPTLEGPSTTTYSSLYPPLTSITPAIACAPPVDITAYTPFSLEESPTALEHPKRPEPSAPPAEKSVVLRFSSPPQPVSERDFTTLIKLSKDYDQAMAASDRNQRLPKEPHPPLIKRLIHTYISPRYHDGSVEERVDESERLLAEHSHHMIDKIMYLETPKTPLEDLSSRIDHYTTKIHDPLRNLFKLNTPLEDSPFPDISGISIESLHNTFLFRMIESLPSDGSENIHFQHIFDRLKFYIHNDGLLGCPLMTDWSQDLLSKKIIHQIAPKELSMARETAKILCELTDAPLSKEACDAQITAFKHAFNALPARDLQTKIELLQSTLSAINDSINILFHEEYEILALPFPSPDRTPRLIENTLRSGYFLKKKRKLNNLLFQLTANSQ